MNEKAIEWAKKNLPITERTRFIGACFFAPLLGVKARPFVETNPFASSFDMDKTKERLAYWYYLLDKFKNGEYLNADFWLPVKYRDYDRKHTHTLFLGRFKTSIGTMVKAVAYTDVHNPINKQGSPIPIVTEEEFKELTKAPYTTGFKYNKADFAGEHNIKFI